MFSHLSVGMQYLYVCVFTVCWGLSFPVSLPFGLWIISLFVSFGLLTAAGTAWPEMLVTHPVKCFFMPLWGMLALGIWALFSFLVQVLFGGVTIMAPGATSDVDLAGIGLSVGIVGLFFFFAYMQLKALHLSGGLLWAGIGSVVLGAVLFLCLCKWIEIHVLWVIVLAVCVQCGVLFMAGHSASGVQPAAVTVCGSNQ